MTAPELGLATFVDLGGRCRALFREDVEAWAHGARAALEATGLRVVLGGGPYHPAERHADDDASARRSVHLPLELRTSVLLLAIAEPLADPLLVPYAAKYASLVVDPPVPVVVVAALGAFTDGPKALDVRASADAAAATCRRLFGPSIAPRGDALALDSEKPESFGTAAEALGPLIAASARIARVHGFKNDLRKHVHETASGSSGRRSDLLAAERLLVAYGVRVREIPVRPIGTEWPPDEDFAARFEAIRARREESRRTDDPSWRDPALDV